MITVPGFDVCRYANFFFLFFFFFFIWLWWTPLTTENFNFIKICRVKITVAQPSLNTWTKSLERGRFEDLLLWGRKPQCTIIAEIFKCVKISYFSFHELPCAINFRTARVASHTTLVSCATKFHTFSQKYEYIKLNRVQKFLSLQWPKPSVIIVGGAKGLLKTTTD